MQRTAGAKDRTRASAVRVQETVPGSMYWRGLLGGAWGHWAFMQRFPPASKFLSPYNTGASPSSSYKPDQHLELSSEQHGCSEMLRESHGLWGRRKKGGQKVAGGWALRCSSCSSSLPLLGPFLPPVVRHVHHFRIPTVKFQVLPCPTSSQDPHLEGACFRFGTWALPQNCPCLSCTPGHPHPTRDCPCVGHYRPSERKVLEASLSASSLLTSFTT